MRNTLQESPRGVAVRKAIEESGEIFSTATQMKIESMNGFVAWMPQSKYCLHFFEIEDEDDMNVDKRFNALPRSRAGGPNKDSRPTVALTWVPLSGLVDVARQRHPSLESALVHKFTLDMIRQLVDLGAFRDIMLEKRPSAKETRASLDGAEGGRAVSIEIKGVARPPYAPKHSGCNLTHPFLRPTRTSQPTWSRFQLAWRSSPLQQLQTERCRGKKAQLLPPLW